MVRGSAFRSHDNHGSLEVVVFLHTTVAMRLVCDHRCTLDILRISTGGRGQGDRRKVGGGKILLEYSKSSMVLA